MNKLTVLNNINKNGSSSFAKAERIQNIYTVKLKELKLKPSLPRSGNQRGQLLL
jgi:hypothetical protein